MNAEQDRISRSTTKKKLEVSFEFFPPKTEKMEQTLWQSIHRLAPLQPSFVSVTYGAGGSTRERTHNTVARMVKETSLKPAAHLTCVGATQDEINSVIADYWQAGVRHIVALRGDSPDGADQAYRSTENGYAGSVDLIKGIKKLGDFEISVSAYPEKHPDSPTMEADIDMLKAKVAVGASRAITQCFFDNALYYRYLERVQKAGVDIPITPGIIPIANFEQICRFAAATGTSIPPWLGQRFEGLENDTETRKLVAAAVAVEQVMDLLDNGVTHFHFYTMNRADLVYAICHMLGMREANQH